MATLPVIVTVRDASGLTASRGATINITDLPSGGGNFPTILNGYAKRPPWQVAGVDYFVGLNPTIVLKNPATAPVPAGVTRYGNTFEVRGNITIDGFDFSNWNVLVYAGAPTFTNNKFARGWLSWRADGTGNGGVIRNNLFDQKSLPDNTCLPILYRPGVYTIERNEFRNSTHMHFQATNGGNGASYFFRQNLLNNCGMGAATIGAHGDFIQVFGGYPVNDIQIVENMVIQNAAGAATQGWSLNASTPKLMKSAILRNTHVIKTNTNYVIITCRQWLMTPMEIRDNYVDRSGVGGAFYQDNSDYGPGPNPSGSTILSGNINMVTGGSI